MDGIAYELGKVAGYFYLFSSSLMQPALLALVITLTIKIARIRRK